MASTMGTARGRTQGSWRPRGRISVILPSRETVFCILAIVAVGLKPTRTTMFSPFEIPPCTPPDRFVDVRILPSRNSKGSLCSDPLSLVAALLDSGMLSKSELEKVKRLIRDYGRSKKK